MDAFKQISECMKSLSVTATEAVIALNKLALSFELNISQEYKKMKLKLKLLENRLALLEGRNTECANIKKKIIRQIRKVKEAMSA